MTPEQLAALVAERDALQAEVTRLSTPPDDAELAALVAKAEKLVVYPVFVVSDPTEDMVRVLCGQLTRLSHALAAEKTKREAMEDALSLIRRADDLREEYHRLPNDRNRIGEKRSRKGRARDAWLRAFRKAAASARATLAKHGSKT